MNRGKPLKAKTGLKRGTGLKQGKPLARRQPMRRGKVSAATAKRPPARRGSMSAAVALVLAGEATVAQAARQCEVNPERLEAAAGKAFRAAVMERDNHTCQHCGAMATEVQHRVARGAGGTTDPRISHGAANGLAVCRPSHLLIETRDADMLRRGFWLKQGTDPARVPVIVATEYGDESRWLLADGGVSLTDPYAEEVAA